MFLVRDIMYCKPGKARAMVDKFLALAKLSDKMGFGAMRVMTDVSAERYWTVVSKMEVPSLKALCGDVTKIDGNEGVPRGHEGVSRFGRPWPTRDLHAGEMKATRDTAANLAPLAESSRRTFSAVRFN